MDPLNPKLMLAIAILCLATVAAVGGPWTATAEDLRDGPVHAWMTKAQVGDFDAFELYWLGPEFDGLDLYGIVRDVGAEVDGEPPPQSLVDFLYGSCDASGGGCPFPLSVQVWPACRRNLSMYSFAGGAMPYEALDVRGVPAARFDEADGGGRLELYTGEVTVVIFGDSPERVERAAEGLRGVGALAEHGAGSAAGDALPQPVDGAMDGRLPCAGA